METIVSLVHTDEAHDIVNEGRKNRREWSSRQGLASTACILLERFDCNCFDLASSYG